MDTLQDKGLRLWGMTVQNLIFFLFFYLRLILEGGQPFWKVIAWQLLFTTAIWEGSRLAIRVSRSRYPALQQLRQRLLLLAAGLLLVALVVGSWHLWMEDWLGFWPGISTKPYSYLYSIGMTLFFSQLIAGVYEALYYLEQWKRSVRETEALEKRNLQTQLDSLKNQVTPHFLFNSLNSLSALVEEDPRRAVRFIEE
ncbi:histidine kinase, partial [Cesiribacter andamanensis]|uniref:histidine kinase n=1 Tax=Cesiribacter andamanensis TaxID=649507 RepID=UPI0013774301